MHPVPSSRPPLQTQLDGLVAVRPDIVECAELIEPGLCTGGVHRDGEVFCFNPNQDIASIAGSKGWDQAKQEQKWLQVYNSVVAVAQEKRQEQDGAGIVHVVWNGDPPQNLLEAWQAAQFDGLGLVRSLTLTCPHTDCHGCSSIRYIIAMGGIHSCVPVCIGW